MRLFGAVAYGALTGPDEASSIGAFQKTDGVRVVAGRADGKDLSKRYASRDDAVYLPHDATFWRGLIVARSMLRVIAGSVLCGPSRCLDESLWRIAVVKYI